MSKSDHRASQRLWEKLAYHRKGFDLDCVNFSTPFPYDQFVAVNTSARDLVHEVEAELHCQISEPECDWAVNALLRWQMGQYNRLVGTTLKPRV